MAAHRESIAHYEPPFTVPSGTFQSNLTISRGRAVAARVAHNHKVAGSSPAPATKIKHSPRRGCFILVMWQDLNMLRLQRSLRQIRANPAP